MDDYKSVMKRIDEAALINEGISDYEADRVTDGEKVMDRVRQKHSKRHEDPFYDSTNQAYILKSVKELQEGKGTTHELIEDEDE